MTSWFAAILWRNLVRLLLAFLAVAFVTWLLVWHEAQYPRDSLIDCAVPDAATGRCL